MVFRKENKVDAFQRQISALRQQLGTEGEREGETDDIPYAEVRDDADLPAEEPAAPRGFGERDATGYSFGGFSAAPAPVAAPIGQQERDYRPYSDLSPAPPVAMVPAADEQTSVIAHDTTWTGDLRTEGTIHVHGRFGGSITARDDVYVAEEADVDATLSAANVVIAGRVKGTIRCAARFEVLPQGRVVGDVQAPTLVIHEGAVIAGQVRTGAPEPIAAGAPPLVQRRAAPGD